MRVEFAGGMVRTSHWLLHTSVFFHMVPAPVASPDWSSVAVITSLGILGAVLGGILLCRRYSRTLDPAQHRSGRITARSDSLKFFSERTVVLLRGDRPFDGYLGRFNGPRAFPARWGPPVYRPLPCAENSQEPVNPARPAPRTPVNNYHSFSGNILLVLNCGC